MSPTTASPQAARLEPPRDRSELLGHPRGLAVLFLTETWAHFSYFGMQAMLVYYMTKQLDFSQPKASALYGGYAAFAYLTPLLGGLLADRKLGQGRSVVLGGLIMAIGHFALAFEGAFFLGLFLVGLGNGFFLPATTTQVGYLYAAGDSRRDRAYSLYYMGVNIGGFLAPLICGTIGELYGWHYGFAVAGVGMLIGLVFYLCNQSVLPREISPPRAGRGAPIALDAKGRRAVLGLLGVAALVVLFRIAYEQSGNTIALWADGRTDRTVHFGASAWVVPATWFQSINPLLIFCLTPVLTIWWTLQARRGREPAPLRKMMIGSGLASLAFLLMLGAARQAEVEGLASWAWLVGFFLLLTLGELFVLPIGLSLFSQMAPPQIASLMIGVWYMAKFAGSLAAGWLGTQWQVLSPSAFFSIGAVFAFAAALAFGLASTRGAAGARPIADPPA
ncbi:peptide MFS transporter [Phenylobacterium sp. LjRoot164]|uniref:peptide MFS transporter n=1 Tax=unclassified Phenylobacterium TaxID=2640670 RepID=UPI003ED03871